jgi:hypothetical protein
MDRREVVILDFAELQKAKAANEGLVSIRSATSQTWGTAQQDLLFAELWRIVNE